MVAFHLLEGNLRLPSAGQWNDGLVHGNEDTVADLSELSFRLSRRTLQSLSQINSSPACTRHPAPVSSAGQQTSLMACPPLRVPGLERLGRALHRPQLRGIAV